VGAPFRDDSTREHGIDMERRMVAHSIEARLCAGGALALATGVLFYVFVRAAQPLPGPWAGSLPTFLHSVAFALLALAVTAPWRRLAPWVCSGWLAVEAAFELLQADAIADAVLSAGLASGPYWLRAFLAGTFDPLDLGAAAAGVLLAFLIATWTAARVEDASR
jgi:hypothetical protein